MILEESGCKMYTVDDLDRVLERFDLPLACTGAPYPVVLSDESNAAVAYVTQKGWNDPARTVPLYAIILFIDYFSYMFGQPDGEAFSVHPLYARGLEPYSFSEVVHSSWIRQLTEMNSVHHRRTDALYKDCRHFILSFHDSTFECIAQEYACILFEGSEAEAIGRMRERFAKT